MSGIDNYGLSGSGDSINRAREAAERDKHRKIEN